MGAIWAISSFRGRRLANGLAFSGGFALAILPSTVTNALVGRSHELILTTYQAGANFYIGNGPGATGTYQAPDFVEANPAREGDDFEAEAWRRSGRPLSPAQVSRFWLGEGLAHWREAPGDSLRLLLTKLGLLMHDFEVPDNQDIEFVRLVASPRLAWAFLSFGWLAPCAVLGLARRDRIAVLVAAAVRDNRSDFLRRRPSSSSVVTEFPGHPAWPCSPELVWSTWQGGCNAETGSRWPGCLACSRSQSRCWRGGRCPTRHPTAGDTP